MMGKDILYLDYEIKSLKKRMRLFGISLFLNISLIILLALVV